MACDRNPGLVSPPGWLPPPLSVNPWTHQTFSVLYELFSRDFRETQPVYRGHTVWFFPDMDDGKEVLFWHLTHREDDITHDRVPDLRRCERLPWVRAIIENTSQPEILDWDYQEGNGKVKTYVWLKNLDFVVIMKKYPDGARRLITSFYVDYGHTRRSLTKKHARRIR